MSKNFKDVEDTSLGNIIHMILFDLYIQIKGTIKEKR